MRFSRTRHVSPNFRIPPDLRYRSAGKAKMSQAQASKIIKTVRMREWLEKLLDEGSCNCLAWVNKEEGKFEITWCHASRHDFDATEHADLFIRYAQLTGRSAVVDERSKNGYNSKLKSNFRSALHSLIDCIQVKETGKGKGENKVYQFIDPSHPEYKRRKAQKNKNQRGSKTQRSSPRQKKRKDSVDYDVQVADNTEEENFTVGDNEILLPDEAHQFFKDAEAHTIELTPEFPCLDAPGAEDTASFSHIPLTNVVLSTVDFCDLSPAGKVESLSESNGQHLVVFAPNDHESLIEDPPSELPNFNALGVDDTFEHAIPHAHQRLNCGGSVRVKKEKPVLSQLAVQDIIDGTDQTEMEYLDSFSFILARNDISLLTPPVSTQSFQNTANPHQLGENTFQPDVGNESDPRPAVLVQYETHDPNFQAENYDIYPTHF